MKERTLRQRLAAHIAVRLVVATVLLGSALVVQLRDPGAWAINPFFFLIGLTYAVSLGFIGSLRFVDRWPWLTDVHFAIDAVDHLGRDHAERRRREPVHHPLHAADRGGGVGAVPARRPAAGHAQQHPVRRPGAAAVSLRRRQHRRAVQPAADRPAAGQRRAVHRGAQHLRLLCRRAAQRVAGGAGAQGRSAARAGDRGDRRPAGVQPVRARQPAERAGHRRRARPPADVQPLGDGDHRPQRARCRSASRPPRCCSCRRPSPRPSRRTWRASAASAPTTSSAGPTARRSTSA